MNSLNKIKIKIQKQLLIIKGSFDCSDCSISFSDCSDCSDCLSISDQKQTNKIRKLELFEMINEFRLTELV